MQYKNLIKSCDWEITNKCNLKCKHCINNQFSKTLNLTHQKLVIDRLYEIGCREINFTGGEPLIEKDFLELLKYSKVKGINNRIITNGTLINSSKIKILKSLITYIGISLEGLEEANDNIRGKGNFKKAIQAINLLKNLKIPFGIYLTLNKINLKDFQSTLLFLKDLKPFNICIHELIYRGNARNNKKELYIKINKKLIIKEIKIVFPEKYKTQHYCQINPKIIFIDSLTNVYVCSEIKQKFPQRKMGNLLNNYNGLINNLNNLNPIHKNILCPYVSIKSNNISLLFQRGP